MGTAWRREGCWRVVFGLGSLGNAEGLLLALKTQKSNSWTCSRDYTGWVLATEPRSATFKASTRPTVLPLQALQNTPQDTQTLPPSISFSWEWTVQKEWAFIHKKTERKVLLPNKFHSWLPSSQQLISICSPKEDREPGRWISRLSAGFVGGPGSIPGTAWSQALPTVTPEQCVSNPWALLEVVQKPWGRCWIPVQWVEHLLPT